MSEARLAKARAGYEGYVYQPPKRLMTLRDLAAGVDEWHQMKEQALRQQLDAIERAYNGQKVLDAWLRVDALRAFD